MEQRFALEGGRGSLNVREEGPRMVARAELPNDGRGLYKVWLVGRDGQMLLGTLMPDQAGRLSLERTLTADALRRQGVWPVTGGRAELVFAFREEKQQGAEPGWERARVPGILLQDVCIREAAAGLGSVLVHREGEAWTLACPFSFDKEFPLSVLFCFSRLKYLGEGLFCLFSFDKNGFPVVPGSE